MSKLKEYIEKWINGEKIKGIKMSLIDIQECIRIYNCIIKKENAEFINGKVKEILDKCKIKTSESSIGWKVIY